MQAEIEDADKAECKPKTTLWVFASRAHDLIENSRRISRLQDS